MALIKFVCTFSIALLFTCTHCNVIRFDKHMNENGIAVQGEGDGNMVPRDNYLTEDNDVKDDNSFIHIDESTSLLLKDTESTGIGSLHHHKQFTSVRHFARHGLCGDDRRMQRFYTALKLKLCNTKGTFILQLVEDLCTEMAICKVANNPEIGKSSECGKSMYNWVTELFDLNGDGLVDHYERHFYESDD